MFAIPAFVGGLFSFLGNAINGGGNAQPPQPPPPKPINWVPIIIGGGGALIFALFGIALITRKN